MSGSDERQTFVMEADGSVAVGLDFEDRFEDLGKLGEGGMGEVRRVRDRRLDRVVAMKRLRGALDGGFVQRFLAEARATARLQHPGIVPVHELGVLDDGRPWFTMKEVHGETLAALLATDTPLRRRLEWLLRVCEAVAYAHDKGVIHRDLKPDNVMVGAFGEVVVLDWGLAHAAGASGGRAGTPLYMAPEQFAGGTLDARTDVFALGVILHEILVGEVPGPTGPAPSGPPELVALCLAALDSDPSNRPADAGDVAAALAEWLEGEQRRQRGLELYRSAQELAPRVEAMRTAAAELRTRAEIALEELASWQPEEDKRDAWALEDEALALDQQAELVKLEVEGRLHASLTQDPDLMASREALAALYRAEHEAALRARDGTEIIRARERLRVQAQALPEGNAVRTTSLAWLDGEARLQVTFRRAVPARLLRFEAEHRRLVPRPVRDLGTTAAVDLRLPHGSYLVELDGAHGTVRYPVFLPRADHWQAEGVRVDVLLDSDECFVPAGPFQSGGDPGASECLEASEPWLDDLVFKRFNVTNAEYIRFLDDLVARGREREALRHAPRERATATGEGALIYGRDADGRFVLRADEDGDVWLPDMPVFMVDWHGASAYAAWLAETTDRPWRLPSELEWEKAARGVDGRFHPWGDFADPAWCNVRNSHREGPRPCPVDSFPVDVSVYGVRGLAGNVKDWCADPYQPRGGAGSDGYRVYKGGNWSGTVRGVRSAFRDGNRETVRVHYIGFRVVRSLARST